MADGNPDNHNAEELYDQPSHFYRIFSGDGDYDEPGEVPLEWDGSEPPEDAGEINQFIQQRNLHHGDVVSFGSMRAEMAYIVMYSASTDSYSWVENPDDAGASYLTIPLEVLKPVRDALAKYQSIINHHTVNLHLPSSDRFIKEHFGESVPENWIFDVYYIEGDLEEVHVRFPNGKSRQINIHQVTLPELIELEQDLNQPQSSFKVKIELQGEKFDEYKERHRDAFPGNYGWTRACPELPQSWSLETGACHMGSNYRKWTWHAKGPQRSLAEAQSSVENFLAGFQYEIEH